MNIINCFLFQDADSDETAQLLAAFVDSYPDSDEPEFGWRLLALIFEN